MRSCFLPWSAAALVGVISASALQNTPDVPAVSLETSTVDTINHTAAARFDMLRKMFETSYPELGRVPEQDPINGVTLDFEIETMAQLRLTPELLLLRGGIDLRSPPPAGVAFLKDSSRPAFLRSGSLLPQDLSNWFSVSLDGLGRFPKNLCNGSVFRQDLRCQIELESVVMRPQAVLDSSFTDDLTLFLEKMGKNRSNALLPGSNHVYYDYGINASYPCRKCHVQWTVGIGLSWVPKLLWMTGHGALRELLLRVHKICWTRENGCTPDYQAFLSLAAWTLHATHACRNCAYPKRCMDPWLVRTHLGDLASHVKEKEDPMSWSRMPHELIQAAAIDNPAAPVLVDGVADYLHFAEMAELSGSVYDRNLSNSEQRPWTKTDLPLDTESLLHLAKRMLKRQRRINQRLSRRRCAIHGKNDAEANGFSAIDWVRGLDRGKDIMSDHDSPISKNAFSHLVWKSMGSWRMRKSGGSRVYLECRNTNKCIPSKIQHQGPPGLIRYVGRTMVDLEQKAANLSAASLQRSLQLKMLEAEAEEQAKSGAQTLYNGFLKVLKGSHDAIMPEHRLMRKDSAVYAK
mmetsp:Transcript_106727/g.189002  ORF Transcript_106727/g.189002 Transcript_106727/m.189002 type:complete len:574 (+) Transcript_106727:88-1809(+)